MKRLRAIPAVLSCLVVLGCATVPPLGDGRGAVLAISCRIEDQSPGWLVYEFGLKGTDATLVVRPRNGVVVFDHLAPGTYTIDGYTLRSGTATYRGLSERQPAGPIVFTLAEGTITILPLAIVVWKEKVNPNLFRQGGRFEPAKRDEVIAELAKSDNFKRWRVAP
jgi:hypothetical protein